MSGSVLHCGKLTWRNFNEWIRFVLQKNTTVYKGNRDSQKRGTWGSHLFRARDGASLKLAWTHF